MEYNIVSHNDCLKALNELPDDCIDMIYLDPPFYTNRIQKLKNKTNEEYTYSDLWKNEKEYEEFLTERIKEMKRVLKNTGSIFIHCDTNANYIIRKIMEQIFGPENFVSEIIWHYKRWSNSKKGLLPNHQTIYFYSKTKDFKFNQIFVDYSESTNIDQILQKRERNIHGKSVYAKDDNGEIILSDEKRGVPLSDVWDIPYLNPKAKERVGYPTQKPIELLEKIITISTDQNDIVLDPFCGSGTTLVAAKILNRNYIGIDISKEALDLINRRLESPIKTESILLKKGRDSYKQADTESLELLNGIEYVPVQRNKGIDAILKKQYLGTPILIRIQKKNESLLEALNYLTKAVKSKKSKKSFLIKRDENDMFVNNESHENIEIINSPIISITKSLEKLHLLKTDSR